MHRILAATAALTFAAVAGAGCEIIDDVRNPPKLGPLVPDAPPPPDAATSSGLCGDSDLRVTTSFATQVQPLMHRPVGSCTCHLTPQRISNLSLDGYFSLRQGGLQYGERIVIAGKPCDSIIVQKLGPAPPGGAQMPSCGAYFTEAEIVVLKDWIAEGAVNN